MFIDNSFGRLSLPLGGGMNDLKQGRC